MSFSNVTRGQASFVSRTKARDFYNSFKDMKTVTDSIYEPTGSNEYSAFSVMGKTGFKLRGTKGGEITNGIISGSIYNVGLSYVSASGGVSVNLYR